MTRPSFFLEDEIYDAGIQIMIERLRKKRRRLTPKQIDKWVKQWLLERAFVHGPDVETLTREQIESRWRFETS